MQEILDENRTISVTPLDLPLLKVDGDQTPTIDQMLHQVNLKKVVPLKEKGHTASSSLI